MRSERNEEEGSHLKGREEMESCPIGRVREAQEESESLNGERKVGVTIGSAVLSRVRLTHQYRNQGELG